MAVQVLVPRVVMPLARQLLSRLSRRSPILYMGQYRSIYSRGVPRFLRSQAYSRNYYRAYSPSAALTGHVGQHAWNRIQVPYLRSLGTAIPLAAVELPSWAEFSYLNSLPAYMPQVALQSPSRSLVWPGERIVGSIVISTPPIHRIGYAPGGTAGKPPPRPEASRKRRDTKVPKAYAQALSFVNRTYGTVSEMGDAYAALAGAKNWLEASQNLAFNQAIDYAFGTRARMLKTHAYQQSWYNLKS